LTTGGGGGAAGGERREEVGDGEGGASVGTLFILGVCVDVNLRRVATVLVSMEVSLYSDT
jgi:hypothetical protein